jgi:DNA-binding NarL/FixJ family response regulator
MIRILICDDQAVVREGLELILGSDSEIEVLALADDGSAAIELAGKHKPDLILMDLNMPGVNGIQATQEIKKQFPEMKILVLTTFGEDEWVFDAIRSGASGYLLKGTPRQELIAAVKGTINGQSHIDPAVGGKILEKLAHSNEPQKTQFANELSEREMDVLTLIAEGFTNVEIAKKLHLSKGTVRNYVSVILSKLDVSDRTQAAVLAIKYGISRKKD